MPPSVPEPGGLRLRAFRGREFESRQERVGGQAAAISAARRAILPTLVPSIISTSTLI
jgi:hypothetical protein